MYPPPLLHLDALRAWLNLPVGNNEEEFSMPLVETNHHLMEAVPMMYVLDDWDLPCLHMKHGLKFIHILIDIWEVHGSTIINNVA